MNDTLSSYEYILSQNTLINQWLLLVVFDCINFLVFFLSLWLFQLIFFVFSSTSEVVLKFKFFANKYGLHELNLRGITATTSLV